MPSPSFSKIHVPCVAPMSFPHGLCQTVLRVRHSYQMHMVPHETVRPDRHVKLPTPLSRQINIDAVILMTKKGRLSAIASLDEVMRHPRRHHSCCLTHRRILSNHTPSSKIKYGVPGTTELLGTTYAELRNLYHITNEVVIIRHY